MGRLIGFFVPYAATISPVVVELAPGKSRIRMVERRRVRNHLRSIHAVALVNLAELAGNLALSTLQPKTGRWIITGFDVEYVRKARGVVEATCSLPGANWTEENDLAGEVIITGSSGEVVVRSQPRWRLGPAVVAAR